MATDMATQPAPSSREGSVIPGLTVDEIVQIGRYRLIRELGKGGFGHVYLADDTTLNRCVAIKVPRWDQPLSSLAAKQFLYEGQMLARVDHPGIVSVYDYGVAEGRIPYVVMQFIDGETLEESLRRSARTPSGIVKLLVEIAEALHAAHRRNLTHRDLKPANVLVDADQRVHLVDFGLALHDEMTIDEVDQTRFAGTRYFMAPEQIRGENHLIDARTDIWAFGVLMYLMLSGRLPFKSGKSGGIRSAICYGAPDPLTTWCDKLEPELQRICLRCLEKQMADRYQTMHAVLGDLVASLELPCVRDQTGLLFPETVWHDEMFLDKTGSAVDADPESPDNEATAAGLEPVASVMRMRLDLNCQISTAGLEPLQPRGLLPYTAADAEMFPELLPGPVDRHGVSESIVFWQTWVHGGGILGESPMGLIFGPSGCGKSSFVLAGLLPRLDESVQSIYLDCNVDDLPATILDRMRVHFPELPDGCDLVTAFREMRLGRVTGKNRKVLLVLDQFEQWLSRYQNHSDHPLIEAMRQSEARHLQILFLVRDDFWRGMSVFFRAVNQRIEEGRNAMALPIPDPRHARKILVAFGRTVGALPPGNTALTLQQVRFVNEVVETLAEVGGLICVYLSVFAETCRNRPWNLTEWATIGGWNGVGREYLERIFERDGDGHPTREIVEDACRILRGLLPHSGEIRGRVVARDDLQRNSGFSERPKRFERALTFLEYTVSLVSRVDDSGTGNLAFESESKVLTRTESDQTASPGRRRSGPQYTLTHDFLVAPIRHWTESRRNATRRGRAEARMDELVARWRATQQHPRALPGLFDFAWILGFLGNEAFLSYRRFWLAAARRTARNLAATVCLLVAVWFVVWRIHEEVQRFVAASWVRSCQSCPAEACLNRASDPPGPIEVVHGELLRARNSAAAHDRFRANLVLFKYGMEPEESLQLMLEDLGGVGTEEVRLLTSVLRMDAERARSMLTGIWNNRGKLPALTDRIEDHRLGVRSALLLSCLGDWNAVATATGWNRFPQRRLAVIEEIAAWQPDFQAWTAPLNDDPGRNNGPLHSAIASGLGMAAPESLQPADRPAAVQYLKDMFTRNPHGGAHYAAGFALDKWNVERPDADPGLVADCEWKTIRIPSLTYGTDHIVEMVLVRPDDLFRATGETDTVTDPVDRPAFWISVHELNETLFFEFTCTPQFGDGEGDRDYLEEFARKEKVPDRDRPCQGISHDQAARFTNWLSHILELEPVYSYDPVSQSFLPEKSKTGFRIPTANQMRLASRAGTSTMYWFGNDPERLTKYTGFNHPDLRFHQFPPNCLGLSETVAGIQEWTDDIRYTDGRIKYFFEVLGGFNQGLLRFCDSSYSVPYPAHYRSADLGVRLVLTEPRIHSDKPSGRD